MLDMIVGLLSGYMIYPIIEVVEKIVKKTWKNTNKEKQAK